MSNKETLDGGVRPEGVEALRDGGVEGVEVEVATDKKDFEVQEATEQTRLSLLPESTIVRNLYKTGFRENAVTGDARRDFAEAVRTGKCRGMTPVVLNELTHLEKLTNPRKRSVSRRVLALSMGGSSFFAAKGVFSPKEGARIEALQKTSVKEEGNTVRSFATANEFWETMIPADFFRWVQDTENENVPIAVTLPLPLKVLKNGDASIIHWAGKVRCDALAPFTPEEMQNGRAPVSLRDSFYKFLDSKDIVVHKESIVFSPNDGVSTAKAYAPYFSEHKGRELGGVIVGTGSNVYLFNKGENSCNSEYAHYQGVEVSDIETVICLRQDIPVTVETIVAGKIMGESFKRTAGKVFEEYSCLQRKIWSLSDDDAILLLFALSYTEQKGVLSNFSDVEKQVLAPVAKAYTTRAANALSDMLLALTGNEPTTLFVDGSFITKSPAFLDDINLTLAQKGGRAVLVSHALKVSGEGAEQVDASLLGTFATGWVSGQK